MRTLHTKLLILFMLVALLPVLAMGTFAYRISAEALKDKAEQGIQSSLEQTGKRIDFQMSIYKKYMDLIVNSQSVNQLLFNHDFSKTSYTTTVNQLKLDELMGEILFQDESVSGLSIYRDKRLVYTYQQGRPLYPDFETSSAYERTLEAGGAIRFEGLPADLDRTDGPAHTYVLGRVITNLLGGDTRHTYTVFLWIKPSYFNKLLTTSLSADEVMLVHDSGQIYARSGEDKAVPRKLNPELERVLEGLPSLRVKEASLAGRPMIVAQVEVPYWGLRIIQSIPQADYLADIRGIAESTLLLGAALLILLFMLSLVLARRVTKPLKAIVTAMKQVQEGHFTVSIENGYKDEFRIVAHSFNYMVVRLRELVERLVQEEKQRGDYEFSMLQYQINPHFVNNTLGSLRLYALSEGHARIGELLGVLSRLFHRALAGAGKLVSVETELATLRDFLRIQQMQYNSRMKICYEIDEEVLGARVPNLLLQPLVENAIFHGLTEDIAEPELHIAVRRDGEDLLLCVRDNGVGMTEETIQSIMASEVPAHRRFNRIGIMNVDKRLKLHYGEPYGVQLQSRTGSGTTAVIRMPWNEGGQEE